MQLFGYKNGDMTQEEALKGFKILLDIKGYTYSERSGKEGGLIIVGDTINLKEVNYIPSGISFANSGHIDLESLEILPENTVFKNHGNVYIDSIKGFSKGVRFENPKELYCNPPIFNPLFHQIPEISPQRVINCYIKQIYG